MHGCQMMRQEDIVGIQKGEKAAARLVNAAVARRAATRIGLANEMNARIAEGFDHLLRIVARAIVDHDDLEILESLRAHGRDGGPKFGGAVVNGNDDAEEWRTHNNAPACRRSNCPASSTVSARHNWLPRGMHC